MGAERLHPVDVARDVPEEEVADAADESRALLEPVERVVDELLHPLAAQLGTGRFPGVWHQ